LPAATFVTTSSERLPAGSPSSSQPSTVTQSSERSETIVSFATEPIVSSCRLVTATGRRSPNVISLPVFV
jgi:hypothetical protein